MSTVRNSRPPARRARWRGLLLGLCGLLIAGVCFWRLQVNQPQDYSSQRQAATVDSPAPDFEAVDGHNQMFRLQRYLGRHRILLVFHGVTQTLSDDPLLAAVLAVAPQLKQQDIQVVGVSTALPQQNRAAAASYRTLPFPLITDIDLKIHENWGRLDPKSGAPLTGVFLIDRKGAVPCFGPTPQPVADFSSLLESLTP